MVIFIIAGAPTCPFYCHALYVAYFLEEHLPNFKVMQKEIEPKTWETWLKQTNHKNNWFHKVSPLVWKELTLVGGKPYYIGGLSQFWEYCYDYYKLESILTKKELKQIIDDMVQYYNYEQLLKESKPIPRTFTLALCGGLPNMISTTLTHLIQLPFLGQWEHVRVKLYGSDNSLMEELHNICLYIDEIPIKSRIKANVENDLPHTILGADLVIVIGDYTREEDEDFKCWLDRNHESMFVLIESINKYAKENLRVVLAMHGPVCFNATILLENCSRIKKHNIVAVTADLGLEALYVLSKELNLPVSSLGAPPVWGFAGINHIIDIHHTVQKYTIYSPNRPKKFSDCTAITGKKYTELRFLGYLTYDLPDFFRKLQERKKQVLATLNRTTIFPKVRAIISLIKSWYGPPDDDKIISLGIYWDEVDAPDIIFSMPVVFEKGRWKPFKEFPKPQKDICEFKNFYPFIYDILISYDIEKKIHEASKIKLA